MIYTFGVHLDLKASEIDSSSPSAIAFIDGTSQTEVFRLLTEQVVSLTPNLSHTRSNRDRGNRNDK